MKIVMDAAPDVLNHNTETVPRLYRQVRLGARYERSLELLRNAPEQLSPETPTKSGLMLGLGETRGRGAARLARPARARRRASSRSASTCAARQPISRCCAMFRRRSSPNIAARAWRSASPTSKPGRWCAAATTPPKPASGERRCTHRPVGKDAGRRIVGNSRRAASVSPETGERVGRAAADA